MGKSSTTHRKFFRKKNVPTNTCTQNQIFILAQSLCDYKKKFARTFIKSVILSRFWAKPYCSFNYSWKATNTVQCPPTNRYHIRKPIILLDSCTEKARTHNGHGCRTVGGHYSMFEHGLRQSDHTQKLDKKSIPIKKFSRQLALLSEPIKLTCTVQNLYLTGKTAPQYNPCILK